MNGETLLEALSLTPGDITLNKTKRPVLGTIVAQCRGLVTHDDLNGGIRLSHQTVHEYMCERSSIAAFQKTIAATCFTRLSLDNTATMDRAGGNVNIESLGLSNDPTLAEILGDIDKDEALDSLDDRVPDQLSDDMPLIKVRLMNFGYAHDFKPDKLDYWADQDASLAAYSGKFAIDHLITSELLSETSPDNLIEPVMAFLRKRPAARLWKELTTNRNRYPAGCTPLHVVAWFQNGPLVKRLLASEHIDINVRDSGGETPLMYAAKDGNLEVIRQLLDLGADASLRNEVGHMAIELLSYDVPQEIARKLLPRDHSISERAVMKPAKAGLHNIVELLLEVGIGHAVKRDRYGNTPLAAACAHGHDKIVELLCKELVDVNVANKWGTTPLHFAANAGAIKCVAWLLKYGADPNVRDSTPETPLISACMSRLPEDVVFTIVSLFLHYKPNLDLNHRATWAGSGLLGAANGISKVGDFNDRPTGAGTALWESANRGRYPKVVGKLIEAGSDIHIEAWEHTPFQIVAVTNPDSRAFKILYEAEQAFALKHGLEFTAANANGDTALHLAAQGSDYKVVEVLLTLPGFSVDTRNLSGQTALFKAMHMRGATIVRILLDAGAETDMTDYRGNSILDLALTAAPRAIIALLLEKPCSISAPWDSDSEDIQQYAAEPWFGRILELIAQRSPNTPPPHDVHTQAELRDLLVKRSVYIDQQVLAIQIPKNEGLSVSRIVFSFRSRDGGEQPPSSFLGNPAC